MKVLLTGGAGYIGYSLARTLHENEEVDEILIYDNLSRTSFHFFTGRENLPKISFIKGDILDSDLLETALKRVDVVYHLAAFVSQPYNHLQNLQYEQVNRWGTLSVARAIEKSGVESRAIYLSSAAVYGFRDDIQPMDSPSPNNAYGDSKYHGEQYFSLIRGKTSTSVIRAGNVFGFNPCMRLDSVINSWIFNGITQGKIQIFGSGDQKRAFVSLETLVDVLASVLKQDKSHSEFGVAVEFCASLNQLRDWLVEKIPGLEYTYLNQNQLFPGQNFPNYPMEQKEIDTLDASFSKMRQFIVI